MEIEKNNKNQAKHIYIHIPFCLKKCNYCAFVSYTSISDYEENYINQLSADIKSLTSSSPIETIYVGGGTPNLLKISSIEKIFKALNSTFNLVNRPEITMEFNPKISDFSYVKSVKEFGVNRISLGAQSFNDRILQILGRIHNTEDTLEAIKHIESAGIDNYSLDLIYGIFNQSLKDVKDDLTVIKSLSPTHISTYGLKIENGTKFASYDTKNLPDDDLNADMYLEICDILNQQGYNHYEISNFAKKNFESKHNLSYWKNNEYIGFGVAAHGYLNNIRYKNSDNLITYIKNPLAKELLNTNTQEDILEEEIFLGLRLKEGINTKTIQEKFGYNLITNKEDIIKEFKESGHVLISKNNLSLTEKGFLISNYIISKLLP